MDIAGLSKLSSDTLVLVVAVLGFMVHMSRGSLQGIGFSRLLDFWLCNRGIRSHR